MSKNDEFSQGTRNILENTVKTIARLKEDIRAHLEQETANLLRIEALNFELMEAKQNDSSIKTNIVAIRQSIAKLEEVEENLRHTLSPMKHLPNDILLYIFRILVQGAYNARQKLAAGWVKPSNFERHLPLRLSGVCRRWREIMSTNSFLWTPAQAILSADSEDAHRQEEEMMAHWTRAKKTTEQGLFVYTWKTECNKLFKRLLDVGSTNWKVIHFGVCSHADESWDLDALSAEEVIVCRAYSYRIDSFAPLLRGASTLTIYGPPPRWGVLPWIHLRSLIVKSLASSTAALPLRFGAADFTAVLTAATGLTELTLNFRVKETLLQNEESPVISHSKLSFLSLHLHHFVAGRGPFGVALSVPSLHKLDFISLHCKARVEDTPFVCRDNPKVLSLPIMDDDEVLLAAELSKWLPDVHTIEVRGQNVDTLFVFFHSLLHPVPPLSLPLPLLKLSSLLITDSDLRGETLIELLESRLRHVRGNTAGICAVTDVRMYNSPGVTVSHWRRVQKLLREGINKAEILSKAEMER